MASILHRLLGARFSDVIIGGYISIFVKLGAAAAFAITSVVAQAAIPVYSNPSVENPALYTFTAAATGTLQAYFAGSTASFEEELGLQINGVDSGVTGLNNKTTANGSSLSFGNVTAGDVLTFYINVISTGDTFYSDKSLNLDGVNHVFSTSYAGGDFGIPSGTLVGFEDQFHGGDLNYNDEKFVFTNVATDSTVPEPASWALMITGLGIVGAAARRRGAAAITA